jgi:LuxR family maltose regulon positive regulatory protein
LGDAEGATVAFLDSERLATVAGDVYTQFMAICERARVSTKGGRLDEAIALLSRAAALGTQAGGPPALWVGLAYVYEAQVLATLGRDAEALARVREGLALSIDRGSPPPIALGRRILFDLLMKAGDLEAAGRELEELHRFARATGMRAALDSYTEAETLLRKAEDGLITGSARAEARLGPKPQGWHTAIPGSLPAGEESQDARTADYIEPLSARELEVLSMIADGMTNQEIANALYLSLGTVKTHAHNIAVKLGSTNRTETVALARELDLLTS